MDLKLCLATYNIRNTTDRYIERRDMLIHEFSSINFDVIGVQEVRFESSCNFIDQTNDIMQIPNSIVLKSVLPIPFLSTDPNFRIDGNSIVVNQSKLRLLSHSDVALSPYRTAQRVLLECIDNPNIKISFTNVHLHHLLQEIDEHIRLEQITTALSWMEKMDSSEHVSISVLVGDFNASPHEPTYSYILSKSYISSFPQCNNQSEPTVTFPTGLQADTMDTDPAVCVDYIFIKQLHINSNKIDNYHTDISLSYVSSSLFGNISHSLDSTLFPSDHIGIMTNIHITSN